MASLQDHIETLERYRQAGLEPGSGTRAILENNLYQAVCRLDASSQLILVEIVRYMVNHLPGDSWGSRERVDNWIRARRKETAEGLHRYSVLSGNEGEPSPEESDGV